MINSCSGLSTVWKSCLVWLSRPLNMVLDIWADFGPLRSKISQDAGETPTFYQSPRLYLPIGIQNCPYFCWRVFFSFLPRVKISGDTCVESETKIFRLRFYSNFISRISNFEGPLFGCQKNLFEYAKNMQKLFVNMLKPQN